MDSLLVSSKLPLSLEVDLLENHANSGSLKVAPVNRESPRHAARHTTYASYKSALSDHKLNKLMIPHRKRRLVTSYRSARLESASRENPLVSCASGVNESLTASATENRWV